MSKNKQLGKKKKRNFTSTTPFKKYSQSSGCNHSLYVNWWWITKKGLGLAFVCADPTLISALWYSWSLCSGLVNNCYRERNTLSYEVKSMSQMLAREYWQSQMQDMGTYIGSLFAM